MSKFNLLTEPWIMVMNADDNNMETISMLDLFKNAHKYSRLAGDTKTQDFAVFRVLLAVLHTVFSRFDENGIPYEFLDLDDKFKPIDDVDENYIDDYDESMWNTWFALWDKGFFPEIVGEYLLKWQDSFYLFDDKKPFFQVTAEDIVYPKINKENPTTFSGKNMNRLISESGNKISMFSPKFENNKSLLTAPEIARWLIMLQSYIGLSDKVIFGEGRYKASKGWLFDIGGLSVQVDNLFKTLLINFVASHSEEQYKAKTQRPCWEYSSEENIDFLMRKQPIDNLAQLYTNWARAIYIDPKTDVSAPFSCNIVKLPEINHQNFFLEPMTLWRYNKTGDNRETYTPMKHKPMRAVWRSFGLITLPNSDEKQQRKPELLEWLTLIKNAVENADLSLMAVGMADDGNATSWVPVDQTCDILRINNFVLTDTDKDGWVIRINDAVDNTKYVVDVIYRRFISDVKEIRNIESKDFVNNEVEKLYSRIDMPFRIWLSSLDTGVQKNKAVFSWYEQLYRLAFDQASDFVSEAGARDYTGIEKKDRILNIATVFNSFEYFLKKKLNYKGGKNAKQ
ncbi:MAG: type I-E CRISPR-associated protein Cse1/CasA [Christensenellales bacterium]|jgi:CRISPR system Cascade subunit CasA